MHRYTDTAKQEDIISFDSPEEYAAYIRALPEGCQGLYTGRRHGESDGYQFDWFGGHSFNSAIKSLELGNTKYLKEAEKLIETMSEHNLFVEGQKIYETDVVGAFPCVPNYLMGQPETMYNEQVTDIQTANTPIKLYVELTCSSHITPNEFKQRGIAILGLVLALKQIRPVELHVFSVGAFRQGTYKEAVGLTMQIETKPLDIGRATFAICDVGFTRRLTYATRLHMFGGATCSHNDSLPWAWDLYNSPDKMEVNYRRVFDMQPHDVFFGGIRMHDTSYRSDPIGWIKNRLDEIANKGDLE